MMNLSSLYKARRAVLFGLFIVSAGAVYAAVTGSLSVEGGAVLVALVLLLAYVVKQLAKVQRAIDMANSVMAAAAKGDLEARATGIGFKGDVAELLHNINRVLDLSDAFVREAKVSLSRVARGEFYRRVIEVGFVGSFRDSAGEINRTTMAMEKKFAGFRELIDRFEGEIREIAHSVGGTAVDMGGLSDSLTDIVELSHQKADKITRSASESSQNVNAVASAVTQLSTTVREITQQINDYTRLTAEAVSASEHSVKSIDELEQATKVIEDVVDFINGIARQTNMLALNATIEAVGAGEYGKGFSVVASEVKALAEQTTRATEEIAEQVGLISERTQNTKNGITDVADAIRNLDHVASAISSAVEQQGASTEEISENMHIVADGTNRVSGNMADVSQAIEKTGEAALDLGNSSHELQSQTGHLEQEVTRFLAQARAVS